MARKRKIPVRKHHGVRDPLKQKAALEEKLKNVINNPPSKDDQSVSRKFSQFIKLLDETPKETKLKKKNSKSTECGNEAIKQLPNESNVKYLRRVNRITTQSLREAEYEIKYNVRVIRDNVTGKVSVEKRVPNEIDEILRNKNQRKGNKQVSVETIDKKTAKMLIKQAIKEDNEENKKESNLEEFKKDIVKFGEVVHAPPAFTVLPRKAVQSDSASRPGRRTNLLLREILKSGVNEIRKNPDSSKKDVKKMLQGKRKDLPPATRAMIETEQSKIVDLYKQIKKNKRKY